MRKLEYKHQLLVLLTIIATFNYLDRYVLGMAMEPIKQELQLNDTQLGFLSGIAFAFFYAVAGIPIARWADWGNRKTIVTLTTGLFSAMVALCGLVANFAQLLLARVGVAVGEAGCLPPAQSLISDFFDRSERPGAMAIYWMCGPFSILIGFLAGGWLVENFGWRIAFFVIGVPGILLALLANCYLREPRLDRDTVEVDKKPTLRAVLTTLWRQRSFRSIVLAFCVSYFFSMGIIQWLPSFFVRSHGMSVSELGVWLAFAWGVFGLIGAYLGGVLPARYAPRKESLHMRGVAIAFAIGSLFFMLVYLSSDRYIALMCLAIVATLFSLINGAIFSAIQSLVDERMRSVALASIFLWSNLIGVGLGPLAVGALSDVLAPTLGQESLRYALVAFSPGYLWVAYYYWRAGDTIEADIRSVESGSMSSDQQIEPLDRDTMRTNQGFPDVGET